jgi:glycosyltransferase involved in cell wall biosynthesis
MERQAIKLADKIFIESNLLIKRFEQFHPGVQKKVSVFRTPVDIARFSPSRSRREEARKELEISADMKVIVAVGRLQWNKNFATLIRAASLLKTKNWLLVVVGQGPEKQALDKLALSLKIADRVRFIGSRSDMERIYAAADVFAHAALMEPYGNVVLEALATGLPCVVSPENYIGVSDELTDEVEALFADPKDPTEWTVKMDLLLGHRQLAARLARRARLFCEQRAQWVAITEGLLGEFGLPRRNHRRFRDTRARMK